MRRVVDLTRIGACNREAEAPDGRVVAYSHEAVHCVGRNVHQVALADFSGLLANDHRAAPVEHVVELMCGVRVRVDGAATGDLELVDQLQRAARLRRQG
jgi:hypothetical protein